MSMQKSDRPTSLQTRALSSVEEAINLMTENKYQEALPLFVGAVEKLNNLIATEANPAQRQKYVEDVEEIKKKIMDIQQQMLYTEVFVQRQLDVLKQGLNYEPPLEIKELRAQGSLPLVMEEQKKMLSLTELYGLENAKKILNDTLVKQIRERSKVLPKNLLKGPILIFGPPGTGKTSLVSGSANVCSETIFYLNCGINTIPVDVAPKLYFYKILSKAKETKPAIILIDDIDHMCTSDDPRMVKLKECFLECDLLGLTQTYEVYIIGATSYPWKITPDVRKKFQKRIEVMLPTEKDRSEIFYSGLKSNSSITKADCEVFAKMTEGMSGYRLSIMLKDILLEAVRKTNEATKFEMTKEGFYIPTSPANPKGIAKTLSEIDPLRLRPPEIEKGDVLNVLVPLLKAMKESGTVDNSEYAKWAKEFEMEFKQKWGGKK